MAGMSRQEQGLVNAHGRFLENSVRAFRLVSLKGFASKPDVSPISEDFADQFRCSLVFLHAAFEDFLRMVATYWLPECAPRELRDIKVPLSELAGNRDLSIQEVIERSVETAMVKKSYGSADEVRKLLSKLNVDRQPFEESLTKLHWMMQRRHQIVHRADIEAEQHEPRPWRLEEMDQLRDTWAAAYSFVRDLLNLIEPFPSNEARQLAQQAWDRHKERIKALSGERTE